MAEYSGILDEHLYQAYLNADFCVIKPEITIKIGQTHPILNELLMDNNAFYYAFITAENPHSKVLSKEENAVRMKDLANLLDGMKCPYLPGYGVDPDRKWPAEQTFLVLGIKPETAIKVGRKYQQNAVVVGGMGIAARLEICI